MLYLLCNISLVYFIKADFYFVKVYKQVPMFYNIYSQEKNIINLKDMTQRKKL